MAQQATTPANQQTARGKQTAGNQQEIVAQGGIGRRYSGALILVGTIFQIPLLAAFLTVVIYLAPADSLARIDSYKLGAIIIALLLGAIITLLAWLLLTLFCMPFATAAGGRQLSYDSIKIELDVLKARHEIVKGADTYATLTEQDKAQLTAEERARYIALADIDENIRSIEQTLQSDGLPWVLNTGYISVWKRIYNAKEAMICLLPPTILIDDTKYDESRLQGSDIPDHENLLTLLQNAIATLSLPSMTAIPMQSSAPQSLQQQPPPTQSLLLQPPQQTEAQARADIRKVSYIIHKFTSERWEGLLRTRNQLMQTALLTGFFTYMLFAITILAGAGPDKIRQVIVFYFLGVIVGLFGRLSTESNQTNSAVDDYGLTISRILVTPLLSGLAALVGVFLVAVASIALITATAAATTHISIGDIYDYTKYPQNLVFAAIFGFVPNLVINVLQQKSEDVKSEIRSSSAADTSTSRDSIGKGSRSTGGSGKNQVGTSPLSSSTNQLNTLSSQLNNITGQLNTLTGQLGTGTSLLPAGPAPGQANSGSAGPLDGGPASGQPSPGGPVSGQASSDGAGPLDGHPASG